MISTVLLLLYNIVIKQLCELHDQEFIQSLSDYLLLTSEEHVPCTPIDLTKAMHSMAASYAYAFYFSKGAHVFRTMA